MISSLPTIAKAAEQIRAGEISPLDLVEFCLSRIERYEDRIHAWVMVDAEGAREEAKRQAETLSEGIDPGPLAGIPIGIKDIIDVIGWPTKAGSPLREGHVAEADAPIVRDLRAAGAIILGKTVTTQFACFDPSPTRNPWNLKHTPGGSSSGSAAAVALEMCMAAIGTQTGGSIIRPASYCGVAGLKPTFGHVSLDGVVPVSKQLDHAGPIARRVNDLLAVYAAIEDRIARLNSGASDGSLRTEGIQRFGFKNLGSEPQPRRFHLIESYFMEHAEPGVAASTRKALKILQDAWSEEQTVTLPPSFDEVHANHYRIMSHDAAENHRREYAASPEAYGPNISSLLDAGHDTSPKDYEAALEHQRRFQADAEQMLSTGAIAVMPSTNTTAPASLDTTGDPRFNSPWSYAGVPSVTIPCGLASDGMPCGLQLVGPRNSEARLLQAAAWCEERIGFQNHPSLLDE
ncbi:MAG: amidase [Planctomycetes bacterium]|nr:amidase [Planctomycetota bacterium]